MIGLWLLSVGLAFALGVYAGLSLKPAPLTWWSRHADLDKPVRWVPIGGAGPILSPTLTEEDAARMATASLDPGGRL